MDQPVYYMLIVSDCAVDLMCIGKKIEFVFKIFYPRLSIELSSY